MTKVLLLLLLGLVIGNANSSTEEGIAKIKEKGRNCTIEIIGDPGWRCSDGTCLPLSNVCDNFDTQCPDGDDSDEVDGCWLFPEEQCKSIGAQKMVKCPHSDQCMPDQDQHLCQEQNKPTNDTTCPFRCKSGHCIAMTFVCNREFECEDHTDETEGCQLHGQAPDQCKSWNGNQFVTCPNDTSICTLPQFVDNCRTCTDTNQWRCNDGWCIDASRINDGVADCDDRSDENSGSIKWWTMLIMVICMIGFGVFASFIVRGIDYRFFFCSRICYIANSVTLRKKRG